MDFTCVRECQRGAAVSPPTIVANVVKATAKGMPVAPSRPKAATNRPCPVPKCEPIAGALVVVAAHTVVIFSWLGSSVPPLQGLHCNVAAFDEFTARC